MSIFGCFFGHEYTTVKRIPGRPHISAKTGLICGRDGDIIKRTCDRCGDISFLNIEGTLKDQETRRKKFREIRAGKRKYYHE